MFKKDDYIVLLNNKYMGYGYPGFLPNHCYKLRDDDYFRPYLDSSGIKYNGWGVVKYDNPEGISQGNDPIRIPWRYATIQEKEMYDALKKPFDTHRISTINKLLV